MIRRKYDDIARCVVAGRAISGCTQRDISCTSADRRCSRNDAAEAAEDDAGDQSYRSLIDSYPLSILYRHCLLHSVAVYNRIFAVAVYDYSLYVTLG